MNRKEFSKKYCETVNQAIEIAEKLIKTDELDFREAVDEERYSRDVAYKIIEKMVNTRDVFEYGLQLITDGNEREFIDKTLSNIIEQEKDEYARTLKRIQKEAVLMILERKEPRLIRAMLNSFTDFKLDEPFEKPPKDSLDFDILKD